MHLIKLESNEMLNLIKNAQLEDFKKLELIQEQVRKSFVFATSNDVYLPFTKYLSTKLEEGLFDYPMNEQYKELILLDIVPNETILFMLSVFESEDSKQDKSNSDMFTSKLPGSFENAINYTFQFGSLNAVKLLMETYKFNDMKFIELAYYNTVEVFFYVLKKTTEISKSSLVNMIEKKIGMTVGAVFNLNIVKELVMTDEIKLSEELLDYTIVNNISLFKKLTDKPYLDKVKTLSKI